jgi:hypothetical protein
LFYKHKLAFLPLASFFAACAQLGLQRRKLQKKGIFQLLSKAEEQVERKQRKSKLGTTYALWLKHVLESFETEFSNNS